MDGNEQALGTPSRVCCDAHSHHAVLPAPGGAYCPAPPARHSLTPLALQLLQQQLRVQAVQQRRRGEAGVPWWAAHLRAVPVRILRACMTFEMGHLSWQAPMQETRVLATGSCP